MDATEYLVKRYMLDLTKPSPIEIPNIGRDILGHWFRDLDYKVGAEIGVERGIFSKILLDAHPTMTLHCVDAWQPYDGYGDRINNDMLPKKFEETKQRLKGFSVKFHRGFSMQAVHEFQDNSLDFVYIDANHSLPWVMDDIVQWSKKVRPGGIVAGHDYVHAPRSKPSKIQVIEALAWYTELKPVRTWFLIGTRAKVLGQIRDRNRSWMWVKE